MNLVMTLLYTRRAMPKARIREVVEAYRLAPSDEAFDRWIVTADTIVLPYRHIWSSSVAERARLLDRPVIATRIGGLEDQLAGHGYATLVDDNNELAAAMRSTVRRAVPDGESTLAS